jgi:GNAT superfamily N-acetyltransferase
MAPPSLVLHNGGVIDLVLDGLRHWCRLMTSGSATGHALERDGVLAAVMPAAPERAVVNSVLYRDADGLQSAYDEVAAAYGEIGANWTVWVPPGDDAGAEFLHRKGHVLDAQPMAMAREVDGVERPPDDALPDWTASGDLADVGPLNDRAYGWGTDSFTRALEGFPAAATNVYVACVDGEPAGCLLMTDHDGNTDVEFVAVVPEARGRGITKNLLGHALADAAERGNRTSTLVATRMGYPIYERVGFRALEPISMWEYRQRG